MCFNNLWSCVDIPIYGLCVGIAKETEAMSNRPIHEQNRDFARDVGFQQHF